VATRNDTYVRGARPEPTELMAWNADGTRMPCRMHSEYLNRLYLKNDARRAASLRWPATASIFHRCTRRCSWSLPKTDHVAPWQAVYKIRALTQSTDYTFPAHQWRP